MRKKLFLLVLLLLGVTSLWAKGFGGGVILQHNGQETFYEGQAAQAAMDAAVEGDTLVFSNGDYPRITMNKKVYIKTSGYLVVDVDIPGNPSLDQCYFQTHGDRVVLTIKSNLQRLYLNDTFVYVSVLAENVGSIEMDRCECWGLYNNAGLKNISASNCYFSGIRLEGETPSIQTASFTNCRFELYDDFKGDGDFTNCILMLNDNGKNVSCTMTNCKFTKCLMDTLLVMGENSSKENCYDLDKENFSSDKDYLLTNNYLGNDNTVVGEYGGTNPFTGGRSSGVRAYIQNMNKKGRKMSPEFYISSN